LSIDPAYKKLPKLKILANTPSIRLNFSDNKIIKLFNFAQNFELPTVPKYATQPNALNTPAALTPVHSAASKEAPSDRPANKKSAKNKQSIKKKKQTDSDDDESDDEEWDGPFRSPKKINGNKSARI